jgi:hypothetical protein
MITALRKREIVNRRQILIGSMLSLVSLMLVPAANATVTVEVLGAGSSMWQTAAFAAWRDLAGPGTQHYTISGTTCPTLGNCAQLKNRAGNALSLGGDLWVVWNSAQTKAWLIFRSIPWPGTAHTFRSRAPGYK